MGTRGSSSSGPSPRRGVSEARSIISGGSCRTPRSGSTISGALSGSAWTSGETLAEIAAATTEAFPDRAEGMEQRLALFATALHHQGLIELRVPDGGTAHEAGTSV